MGQVRYTEFRMLPRKFKSLSAVAREITGTRWNGYRFFGMRERKREAT